MESFVALIVTGNLLLSLPKLDAKDKLPLTVPVPFVTFVTNDGLVIVEPPESVIVISLVTTLPDKFC